MKRHKRFWIGAAMFASIAGLATLPAFTQQLATPAAALVPGRSAEIPFELYRDSRMVLSGRINGTETAMLLDSGAGATTLDIAFARKIGLTGGQKISAQGIAGEQDAELYHNVTVEAGNLKLSGVTVIAIDLSQISKGIGRPVPVILGRELFVNSVVGIDFERNLMTLTPSADFLPPAGATKVALEKEDTLHFISISIDGLPPVLAAFDLGNGGAVSLSREYLDKHPTLGRLPYAVSMSGGVGGLNESRRASLPKVAMAGFEFERVPATLELNKDGPHAGRANVGIQMFRPFKLTLDLGHDRLWLQRTGAPVDFPRDRAGIFPMLEGDHLNILHVSPGSPADKAGLKKGDSIVAVNGEAVGPELVKKSWQRLPAGTRVDLTRSDGQVLTMTLADYY